MNIENLKCFILVAEKLSFSRAAEAMYISQPAVTKQINALENELGVSLFIRSTHHVELTPAGMSFYNDAKDIVSKSYQAIERIKSHSCSAETLSVGVSNPTILNYISPFIKKFNTLNPNTSINLEVLNHNIILNLFNDKRIDALFYYKENFNARVKCKFIDIYKDSLYCLIPKNHALAGNKTIALKDLKNENIIICNPLNAPAAISEFQEKTLKHLSANKNLYCNSIEIAHCLVCAEAGITVMPGLLCPINPDIVAVKLQNSPEYTFGCFCHTQNKNEALKKLLKIL